MKTVDAYVEGFERWERQVENRPGWVTALRKGGIARFADQGFPTTRHEDWRYTNVAPIAELMPHWAPAHGPVALADLNGDKLGDLRCWRLVFVNGRLAPGRSVLPDDGRVKLANLQTVLQSDGCRLEQYLGRLAKADENPFVALNQALFHDGAYLEIPEGVALDRPVHLLFIGNATHPGTAILPRNFIRLGPGSRATVIEHYASLTPTPCFTDTVSELLVEGGAALEYCKIQEEDERSLHVATIQARQGSDSRLLLHSIASGARLARNDLGTVLGAPGADSVFNGLYLAGGEQLVDHHTVMDHAQPHCTSHEYFHGILGGAARGVFNGKIFVRPDAQKTDAKQTNKNILLSETAEVDTKPQLEIFADDVKCTHGATVGQLDEQAVFYLRARGIGEARARRMLLHAFASEVLDRVGLPEVRAFFEPRLFERLHRPDMLGEN